MAGPQGYALRRAFTCEEWEAVGRLREREGFRPHDEVDESVHSITFLLTRGSRPIGTTRTTAPPEALPAFSAYSIPCSNAALAGAALVEAGLTAVDASATLDTKAALFHLFKAHLLHCRMAAAGYLLTAVREAEIGFYRRMFNMEILSGAEPYPDARLRVLMGLDVRTHVQALCRRLPMITLGEGDCDAFAASGRVLLPGDRR